MFDPEVVELGRASTVRRRGAALKYWPALVGVGLAAMLAWVAGGQTTTATHSVPAATQGSFDPTPTSTPATSSAPAVGGRTNRVVLPYCGLHCLYATMLLEGRPVDFAELLKPEYIGQRAGSTLGELEKAAKDHGMNAVVAGRLTPRDLLNCPYPAILHVKATADSLDYDHYELFLGTRPGEARLLDPSRPVRWVSFDDLALRWDGNAMLISAAPIDFAAVVWPTRARFVIYLVTGMALIVVWHRTKKRWIKEATSGRGFVIGSIQQMAALAGVALMVGVIYHSRAEAGLLAHPREAAAIQRAHFKALAPRVDVEQVKQLIKAGAVVVDARYPADFLAGHLPGARSIPVESTREERVRAMTGVSETAQIVIYCQSKGCSFAAKVGAGLEGDGFQNISVFTGGWQEWKEMTARQQ